MRLRVVAASYPGQRNHLHRRRRDCVFYETHRLTKRCPRSDSLHTNPEIHMRSLAFLFLLATLLCFASGLILFVAAALSSLMPRLASPRATKVPAFTFVSCATALCVTYLIPFAFVITDPGSRAAYLAGPDAWSTWLFLGCVLVPHLLWCARFRRPISAAIIALIALSGITPEFFSVLAAA